MVIYVYLFIYLCIGLIMPQGITLTEALLLSVVLARQLLLMYTEIMFGTGFASIDSLDIQIDNTLLYLSYDKEVKVK